MKASIPEEAIRQGEAQIKADVTSVSSLEQSLNQREVVVFLHVTLVQVRPALLSLYGHLKDRLPRTLPLKLASKMRLHLQRADVIHGLP